MTNSGVTTDRRRLPVSDWPDLDRAIWRKETEAKDLTEARSPAVRWRPRTCQGVAGAYGQWLAFLFSREWLNQNQQPQKRPTKARVLAYVESLQSECAPVTVGILIRGLYDIAGIEVDDRAVEIVRPIRTARTRIVFPAGVIHKVIDDQLATAIE